MTFKAFLSFVSQHRAGAVLTLGSVFTLFQLYRHVMDNKRRLKLEAEEEHSLMEAGGAVHTGRKKERVALNAEFFARLKKLLGIIIPSWTSREAGLVYVHLAFLVARTFLSIYVARLDGSIVRTIVDRNGLAFARELGKWFGVGLIASYANTMLRYLESSIAVAFRARLTQYAHELYFNNDTFYRVAGLQGTSLADADQCLTEDLARFCNHCSHLFSSLSKPILDIVLMSAELLILISNKPGASLLSSLAPVGLTVGVVAGTGVLLRAAQPPLGKLVEEQARRDGFLRATHSRIITHAEEIAFYGGSVVEKSGLNNAFNLLKKHMYSMFRQRIFYTWLEQMSMKYTWSASGMCLLALSALMSNANVKSQEAAAVSAKSTNESSTTIEKPKRKDDDDSVSSRTQDFVVSRGLLVSAADAIERVLSSYKEVTELAGYTSRVFRMLNTFEVCNSGPAMPPARLIFPSGEVGKEDIVIPTSSVTTGAIDIKNPLRPVPAGADLKRSDLMLVGGAIVEEASEANGQEEVLKLDRVPIVTPAGEVLVPSMTIEIKRGMHTVVTGPNGCGKSSLFRIISGLWPILGGKVVHPPRGSVFWIPQKPYFTHGNLRQQIIYPQSEEEAKMNGITDDDLLEILRSVFLGDLASRPGGFDAVLNWHDALSGGEKQRLAFGRMLYHKPNFAILDEATSAVSIDSESPIYQLALDAGITLISVSHRPTLWKFHKYLLRFDGEGGYRFGTIESESQVVEKTRLSLAEEKQKLESQLSGLNQSVRRLRQVCRLLNEDSIVLKSDLIASLLHRIPSVPSMTALAAAANAAHQ